MEIQEKLKDVHLIDELEETFKELKEQLIEDEKRWGDTWKARTRDGQEFRIQNDYNDYFDKFKYTGTPVNWLSVIGNAHIAKVRERYNAD